MCGRWFDIRGGGGGGGDMRDSLMLWEKGSV